MSLAPTSVAVPRRLAALVVLALVATLPALGLGPVPRADAAGPTLSHVGAASTAGSRTTHSVRVPATVVLGDTLVLFLTTNTLSGTVGAPAGWQLLQSKEGKASRGRVWTRKATAADANALVSLRSSVTVKSTLSLVAYRSSAGASAVTASSGATVAAGRTSHTTPAVAVAQPGSWLVSSWAEKSSATNTWTKPTAAVRRTGAAATGTSKVSSLVADFAGVPTGTAAGRVARTSRAGTSTQLFSVVVSPGVATDTNRAPVAAFTTSCTAMRCSFDAGGSTDADGDPLNFSWSFGDGSTGSGATTSRTYTTTGAKTVTLTVDDGRTATRTTRPVTTSAGQPVPGHKALVPETVRTDLPKISNGEIWDIEVVGSRVFIAGSFTSIRNQRSNNTTSYTRTGLASYNLTTGLVDASFRPTFGGGGVDAVEATPDGTRLYVAGNFSTVNGVSKRGLARLDLSTGAAVAGFTAQLDARATELATSASTVYVGGRFTKVNNVARRSLAAVDATTGAVDTAFVNNLSGGIGVNGALGVQRLVITHDLTRLLVVHTGRQVNDQDRYGIALIDTATKKLLPWRTDLWKDNLQFVGGIQRIFGGDISPDDEWFAVTSGSGGDRPPINDTVVAFPLAGGDDVQPRWISRHFDSVYSIAISEKAVYVGGHMGWAESPTAPDPWPGLDDVGYGTGQGLSGYGLGDAVVNREHLAALNPVDGKALEWNPGSNSYEGNKAMEATSRGLFTGGDATTQGGSSVGRIAFFDFNSVPAGNGVETEITEPISGRVNPVAEAWQVRGTAAVPSGTVARVELEVIDRSNGRYLADNLTTWGTAANSVNAKLTTTGARSTTWSQPLTIMGNRKLQLRARTVSSSGAVDGTKAVKKAETFGLTDQPPNTNVTGPSSSLVRTSTYTVTGTASDDVGVRSVGMTIRDGSNRYLQADGTVSSTGHTFRITPDVVGATSTTWSREITVPSEGTWKAQARAVDTAGQSDLDTADREWIVSESGQAPSVSISAPTVMVPPTAAQTLVVAPGSPLTFRGSATDDEALNDVEITLRNNTTRENLASDGTWGQDAIQDWYRISPVNLTGSSHNWAWTTPFNLKAGNYSFSVRATDTLGLTTSSANRGNLTINAQVPGDAPPDGTLDVTGTVTGGQSLALDLAGKATDDKGVKAVRVSLRDQDTSRYLQPNGAMSSSFATLPATVSPADGTSVTWRLPVTLPVQGDWAVTAYAVDTADQQDTSTSGATARYRIYPGDTPPAMTEALLAPTEGSTFTDGRIFVSGRAEDDQAMQRVEVAVIDAQGRYLSSSGAFTSTSPSWRTAFLTSPGTVGSNFSYTTPVVPPGAYTVQMRGIDQHDLVTATPSVRHVTVTHPAGNDAPTARFTVSCQQNVCTYDGRTSTDENVPTLTYAWSFGNGSGSGPLPTRTYTGPGTYTVTLTVKDEWGISSPVATQTVTITEPGGNLAPTPVINLPSCAQLVCNISGVGSADPNAGDTFSYLWDFGDGSATSTSSAPSHTFPTSGTWTVRLTTTDGWGRAKSITRDVTVNGP